MEIAASCEQNPTEKPRAGRVAFAPSALRFWFGLSGLALAFAWHHLSRFELSILTQNGVFFPSRPGRPWGTTPRRWQRYSAADGVSVSIAGVHGSVTYL